MEVEAEVDARVADDWYNLCLSPTRVPSHLPNSSTFYCVTKYSPCLPISSHSTIIIVKNSRNCNISPPPSNLIYEYPVGHPLPFVSRYRYHGNSNECKQPLRKYKVFPWSRGHQLTLSFPSGKSWNSCLLFPLPYYNHVIGRQWVLASGAVHPSVVGCLLLSVQWYLLCIISMARWVCPGCTGKCLLWRVQMNPLADVHPLSSGGSLRLHIDNSNSSYAHFHLWIQLHTGSRCWHYVMFSRCTILDELGLFCQPP